MAVAVGAGGVDVTVLDVVGGVVVTVTLGAGLTVDTGVASSAGQP